MDKLMITRLFEEDKIINNNEFAIKNKIKFFAKQFNILMNNITDLNQIYYNLIDKYGDKEKFNDEEIQIELLDFINS
jgi:hypothetical protein